VLHLVFFVVVAVVDDQQYPVCYTTLNATIGGMKSVISVAAGGIETVGSENNSDGSPNSV